MSKLFFGEEGFLVKRKIFQEIRFFLEKNPNAKIEKFEAGQGQNKLDEFKEKYRQGGGLFSSKKLLVLDNAEELVKEEQEEIAKILEDSRVNEVLLGWVGKKQKNKLFSFFAEKNGLEEIKKLNSQQIGEWIKEETAFRTGNKLGINQSAVSRLDVFFGRDMWRLDRELEKLINYCVGAKEISPEIVDRLCAGNIETKIFALVDAIGKKDKRKSLEQIGFLISQGDDQFYIFSMMVYQMRNLAQVFNCRKKGIFSARAISREIGLHPYVAEKTLRQAGNFSEKKIKNLYELLSRLDNLIKTGKIEIKEALLDFTVKV